MIGHVTLTAIDLDRPASHSKHVISGIIRQKWNYQGVIITDDLVMGAIYNHDVCTAVVEALNAGVDLPLVAYDSSQFYRIFACASGAFSQGRLDVATLRDSETRLQRTLPLVEGERAQGARTIFPVRSIGPVKRIFPPTGSSRRGCPRSWAKSLSE
jgi:beta-N-acetylhexosaminidase